MSNYLALLFYNVSSTDRDLVCFVLCCISSTTNTLDTWEMLVTCILLAKFWGQQSRHCPCPYVIVPLDDEGRTMLGAV